MSCIAALETAGRGITRHPPNRKKNLCVSKLLKLNPTPARSPLFRTVAGGVEQGVCQGVECLTGRSDFLALTVRVYGREKMPCLKMLPSA